ncbi:GspL/Epsl periplasmic domain-containing protein [Pseudomonas sp. Rh2]|uniref:GspL/Epsl periplasmic domain-containing protein n=1 Tax=Pseudomonas TaxID=286 RepID=UPI0004864D72|nr:GspL/Epsl periplasmic domain-containing protein [Pseudomonas taiwanensis]
MMLEWRRRTANRPRLLLRPGIVWDWMLIDTRGATTEGVGKPPVQEDVQVVLIIPAQHCSQFQVAAPPRLKREEWPMLLEDRLLEHPEDVVCARLCAPPGQLQLLVVARQALAGWREQCAEWGLQAEHCWAEFQLMPMPEPGAAWQWRRSSGLTLFKGMTAEANELWLAWPDGLGELPEHPWSSLRRQFMEGPWPTPLASLAQLPRVFEQRGGACKLPGVSRQQRGLLVACLLLACTWGGVCLTQQWHQAQVWRAEVAAVAGEHASPRQAAQALKRLREGQVQQQLRLRQLDELQARLQGWLREHPQWRLQAVRFDGQRWHLRLEGDGVAPPWREMAETAGARVEVQGGTPALQWQVTFDLGDAV